MNNRKRVIFNCLMFFLLFGDFFLNEGFSQRDEYNFNNGWKLHVRDVLNAENQDFNDLEWGDVMLPYAWNQEEAFKKDIKD